MTRAVPSTLLAPYGQAREPGISNDGPSLALRLDGTTSDV